MLTLSDLRSLECRHCGLKRINTQIYHLLPYLTHLDLGYNEIQFLANDEFQDLHRLHTLKLDGNLFPVILENTFVNQQQLKYLCLARNRIAKIPDTALKNLTSLIELDIGYNKLSKAESVAFSYVKKSLVKLIISGNKFRLNIVKDLLDVLTSIRDLSIAHMRLVSIPEGFFPERIRNLNLSGNNLTELTVGMFPKHLQLLDINANDIRGLNDSVLTFFESIPHIKFRDNPWTCDLCHISDIFFRVNHTNLFLNTTCAFPSVLKGKSLQRLTLDEIPACSDSGGGEEDPFGSNKKGLIIGLVCIVTFAVSSIIFVVCSCVRRHHQNEARRRKRAAECQENNLDHSTAIFTKNQLNFQFPLDLTERKLSVSTIGEIKKDDRQGMSNGTITTGL
ncbi:hypothetical protein GWI33_020360 [Rhynchophorus ferrugineus]|uniref:Uncharacterized protein n=1 Tax=Rhynchophorus ferrugineus TaxID=354439 RepID=A0A834HSM3_RHYFE|nr:hypothetical protein GWI33_020360 [Rhynchophorus ferrugineus]